MREIKFRAWDTWNQCMFFMNEDLSNSMSKFFEGYEHLNDGENEPVLMQYTGLKDKNGKEIYEGDLMIHPEFQGTVKLQVRIVDGCTYLDAWDCIRTDLTKGEIIGNIHENN